MSLSPDETVWWQLGVVKLNLTILTTWGLMLVLWLGSRWVTRRLQVEGPMSRWQSLLEIVVHAIRHQMAEIGLPRPDPYLPFLGTLFLFVAAANLFIILPGYEAPTGSLSTTTALALCVFGAVPYFGIRDQGWLGYFRSYAEPSLFMLPFNIIGEISRTLALAMRLFGNIMSGSLVVAILLSLAPFFIPVLMNALGLLTGLVQAYILSVLATVYVAAGCGSASVPSPESLPSTPTPTKGKHHG